MQIPLVPRLLVRWTEADSVTDSEPSEKPQETMMTCTNFSGGKQHWQGSPSPEG